MKKRTLFAWVFIFALLLGVVPSAWAEETNTTQAGKTLSLPLLGFSLRLPEGLSQLQGCICLEHQRISDDIDEIFIVYSTMTEDEYKSYMAGNDALWQGNSIDPLCSLYITDGSLGLDELVSELQRLYPNGYFKGIEPLTSIGEKNLFALIYRRGEDYLGEGFTDEKKAEYAKAYDAMEEILGSITLTDPVQALKPGEVLTFKTQTLDGSEISSEELFAKNKITMINNWATWCGPCVEEMPELERLHQEFQEKGGAVIGIVRDVSIAYDAPRDEAKAILERRGVSYLNLITCDEIVYAMQLSILPTTFFVDSEGKLVGEIVEGARVSQYEAVMRSLLGE